MFFITYLIESVLHAANTVSIELQQRNDCEVMAHVLLIQGTYQAMQLMEHFQCAVSPVSATLY